MENVALCVRVYVCVCVCVCVKERMRERERAYHTKYVNRYTGCCFFLFRCWSHLHITQQLSLACLPYMNTVREEERVRERVCLFAMHLYGVVAFESCQYYRGTSITGCVKIQYTDSFLQSIFSKNIFYTQCDN